MRPIRNIFLFAILIFSVSYSLNANAASVVYTCDKSKVITSLKNIKKFAKYIGAAFDYAIVGVAPSAQVADTAILAGLSQSGSIGSIVTASCPITVRVRAMVPGPSGGAPVTSESEVVMNGTYYAKKALP